MVVQLATTRWFSLFWHNQILGRVDFQFKLAYWKQIKFERTQTDMFR